MGKIYANARNRNNCSGYDLDEREMLGTEPVVLCQV